MSRSSISFSQLIEYLDKEDELERHSWNMYANKHNKKEINKEFVVNAQYIKESRGKNYLYHEVLALQPNNLSLDKQREILYDLASKYVKHRANNHLVFSSMHNDTDNLHMHLIISANEIGSNQRLSLKKEEFLKIQKDLEDYKNEKYPELEKTSFYQKNKDYSKSKQKEQELKHRRKKQSKKEKVKEELQEIFKKAQSKEALKKTLKSKGYEFYERGNTRGVKQENKSYRFKTLGVDKEYQKTLNDLDKKMQREEKRQEFKNSKTNQKQKSKNQEFNFSR